MEQDADRIAPVLFPSLVREDLQPVLRRLFHEMKAKIIVLDDDPTGTQTVHETNVLLEWDKEELLREIKNEEPVLYLLTNSRSLEEKAAVELAFSIGSMIKGLSSKTDKKLILISRSDSTLRGHYPAEVDALARGSGIRNPLHILIPAFIEGGRYTIDDIQYVHDRNRLVPVGETEFARDPTFGFKASNLVQWVIEKSLGAITGNEITSVPLNELRGPDTSSLCHRLPLMDTERVLIVNAAHEQDLKVFALSFYQSLMGHREVLFRSAASIVPVLAGMPSQIRIHAGDLSARHSEGCGGLVVVGSYVRKTTQQLSCVLEKDGKNTVEVCLDQLLNKSGSRVYQSRLSKLISGQLAADQLVVVYTSRRLYKGNSASENMKIGRTIADGLNAIIKHIDVSPRFFVAKGGITSCEMARICMGANRARVIGAIRPGIPVWQLKGNPRRANIPFIVFPGNVGEDSTLLEILTELTEAFLPAYQSRPG